MLRASPVRAAAHQPADRADSLRKNAWPLGRRAVESVVRRRRTLRPKHRINNLALRSATRALSLRCSSHRPVHHPPSPYAHDERAGACARARVPTLWRATHTPGFAGRLWGGQHAAPQVGQGGVCGQGCGASAPGGPQQPYALHCPGLTPSRSQSEASADAQRAQVSASLGIVVRKALNQQDMISRDFNAELRAKVGTKTLINPEDPGAAGFYCKETGKTLRDSISYLDHINGKRRACARLRCCVPLLASHSARRAKGAGHEHARGAQHAGGGAGAVQRAPAAQGGAAACGAQLPGARRLCGGGGGATTGRQAGAKAAEEGAPLARCTQACCALTRAPAPRRSSRSSCRSRPRRRRV